MCQNERLICLRMNFKDSFLQALKKEASLYKTPFPKTESNHQLWTDQHGEATVAERCNSQPEGELLN